MLDQWGHSVIYTGADPGGGAPDAPPPLKLEKIWFFWVKSLFFTRNTPTNFAPPSARCNIFKCTPPNLKSWIHPWYMTCEWVIVAQHQVRNISAISWREQIVILMRWWWCLICTNILSWNFIVSSLKQREQTEHDSQATSLCSYSFMPRA